ncbi:alpha/beta fold hydrolase [Microbacterium sp. No. 7]|uniref:alpha/beta fold hydrolase n=1 Tax=Microbacterium sp. No. 7 TaxID=1714373 RepID=UPI0006CF8E4D|nr:alpha/beta hydrolase [Microbacterium sp. No. 7]ALJ21524.1 alpha/beta hydrolase [Microbacterium sp. No. 7]
MDAEPLERAAQAVTDAASTAAEAIDRAIDDATGMPDPGDVESFTHDGACLVAETYGDRAAPRTFVLVHGIGMGRKVFGDLVTHLEPHGLVVAIDQPGYGEAPEPPRTPTMERTADLVAAYLRHLDRGPVVLLGHSMGTQVVTEVAVRHPAAVDRLVLVAPTVDRRHRHALSQLARLGVDLLGESPKVLLLGAREYLRASPNLRRKMRAMLTHTPERSYPRVPAPTLVVRGETDRVSPRAWCEEVAAAIPRSETFEVAGHGHETLIRDAAPTADALLRWLSTPA